MVKARIRYSNKRLLRKSVLLVLLIMAAASTGLIAQTTGKLAGRITEAASGDGLPGVNVFIQGTTMGAATDSEGYYTVLNVPPGVYDLVVSAIGYKKVIYQDLVCRVNYTTTVSVALEEEAVDIGERVTIVAERPLIEKDQTGSRDVVTSQEIKALPVTNFDQVVSLQSGVVNGHFRGGRSSEVLYLVDGIAVLEPLSGGRSVTVGIQAIENLEVISGTFNAEYGKAMSGIVNAVTKAGSKRYSGNLEFYSGNFVSTNERLYPQNDALNPDGILDVRATLEGPVPLFGRKLSFLFSGGYAKNDGYLFGYRYFLPGDISIPGDQGQHAIFRATGDSAQVSMGDSEDINLLGKLHYSLSNSFQLSYAFLYNNRDAHELWAFNPQWRWAPEGIKKQRNEAFNHIFTVKQVLGSKAFYTLKLAFQQHDFGNFLFDDPLSNGYLPGEFRQTDLTGNNLIIGGTELTDNRRHSETFILKGDFTWQATRQHEFKLGLEGIKYDVSEKRRTILFANAQTFNSEQNLGLVAGWRERPIHNELVEIDFQYYHTSEAGDASVYSRSPIQGGLYLQDKMEFSSVVVNAGLRLDYFDPRFGVPRDLTDPNGRFSHPELSRSEALDRSLEEAPVRMQLSPRFGLAYQVTENGVINFSYGHFFQIPPLEFLYGNPKFLVLPGTVSSIVMGNAGLKAQKTVSYELTYRELLTENVASEISFFFRDIFDLLGTESLETINGQRYTRYANRAFGTVKGIVLSLDIRRGPFFADIDYTFQVAKGSASDPNATLIAMQNGRRPNEESIRLDWDQRHTVNASINYSNQNYTVSLLGRFGSGNPFDFQPLPTPGRPILQFIENNGQMPGNFSLDLNASYRLGRYAGFNASVYLQGFNILDNRNPAFVFGDSGSPESTATLERDRASLEKATFTTPEDIRLGANAFTAPREIRLGMALSF